MENEDQGTTRDHTTEHLPEVRSAQSSSSVALQPSTEATEPDLTDPETKDPPHHLTTSNTTAASESIIGSATSVPRDQTQEKRPSSRDSSTSKDVGCIPRAHKDSPSFRVREFASRQHLAHFFPQIEDDEKSSLRIWFSKRSRALLLHIGIVAAILLTNFALTLWGLTHYPSSHGVATVYQGSCDFVKRLNLWLHLLINVLSTGMLMASSYCLQLQAAPTRKDVDKAHAARDWLDIGVISLRNLRYVSNWRRFSWLLLALSSLPVHLLYNSAVFSSLASADYTVVVVNEAFLSGGGWNLTRAEQRGLGDPGYNWIVNNATAIRWYTPTMPAEDTIRAMQANGDYWATVANVIIITSNQSVQGQDDDTLMLYTSVVPKSDDWAKNQWAIENGTKVATQDRTKQPQFPISSWYLGPEYYKVDYCLLQPPPTSTDRCRFEYAPGIMVVICIINFVKICVMSSVWFARLRNAKQRRIASRHKEIAVLDTLGDAVASFMRQPDPTTMGMCLATRKDFQGHQVAEANREPRQWQEQDVFWNSAASLRRWITLLLLWVGFAQCKDSITLTGDYSYSCILIPAIASVSLARTLSSLSARGISRRIPNLWNLGFGALTPFTFLEIGLPRHDPSGLISNVLVANLPQFILSVLYILYNRMISTFLVQQEFSRMKSVRKPLRVSEPLGIQRGSYFISLPLRYGIPLYGTSALMHWLISQSIFLARITAFFPDGNVDAGNSFSTCGYSPIALFITILVGICLVLGVVGIGFRKYDKEMPLVASNSRAISAACHVLPEDTENGYMLPVQWGVVKVDGNVGHCAFTTAWDLLSRVEAQENAQAERFA